MENFIENESKHPIGKKMQSDFEYFGGWKFFPDMMWQFYTHKYIHKKNGI